MVWFRRSLILLHRYLGIALSLLFVVWFATGITMMYAGGMPRLTPQMRLERMTGLDLEAIRLSPAEALDRADLGTTPGRVTLLTVLGRPAYRFASSAGPTTVFADAGDLLAEVDRDGATRIASRFMNLPEDKLEYVEFVTRPDQWTIAQGRDMPQHRFRVDDPERTELYVSAELGEVSVLTTRKSRTLAWIGTIPHWFYFAALRRNQPLWYQIVVWTSALGCVLAILGLALGVTQFKGKRPFRLTSLSSYIPYSGGMRWHYITGVIFGVFTLTWVFSGMLSMEPFGWGTNPGLTIRRDVMTGGPVDLSRFSSMDPATWSRLLDGRAIKEVEFTRIQDEPYYVVRPGRDPVLALERRERLHQPYNVTGRSDGERVLVAAQSLEVRNEPFSVDSLLARLKSAAPDVPVLEAQLLPEYDSYYYSRGRQTPLPILRVKFGDPDRTWVYVDPEMSQVVARIHRLDRVERWLYNGLHSLDFSFWYNRRPLWDIGVIALSLGGLASSSIGLFFGIRRLRRGATRLVKTVAGETLGPGRRDVGHVLEP
jgi:hypothetical protein